MPCSVFDGLLLLFVHPFTMGIMHASLLPLARSLAFFFPRSRILFSLSSRSLCPFSLSLLSLLSLFLQFRLWRSVFLIYLLGLAQWVTYVGKQSGDGELFRSIRYAEYIEGAKAAHYNIYPVPALACVFDCLVVASVLSIHYLSLFISVTWPC